MFMHNVIDTLPQPVDLLGLSPAIRVPIPIQHLDAVPSCPFLDELRIDTGMQQVRCPNVLPMY